MILNVIVFMYYLRVFKSTSKNLKNKKLITQIGSIKQL